MVAEMPIRRIFACIFVAGMFGCSNVPGLRDAERTIAIVGATVVHPEREAAQATQRDSVIVISGRRIVAVGPAASTPVPAGATIVDGRGKWVVPGYVDAHVHFFQSGNLYTRPDAADFSAMVPYAKEVERNKARLPAT